MSLDWGQARVFLAVARAGSLVGAARTLGVSEATVGRRLVALEEALGSRLFDRLPNSLSPTRLGRRLLAAAEAMEEGAAEIERLVLAERGEAPGPVRVTATSSVALFLARRLDRLVTAAGGATVELAGSRAVASLAHREAEVALRMRRPPERGDLVVRRIGRVAFAPYTATTLLTDNPPFIGLRPDPTSRQSAWLDALAAGAPMPLRLDEVSLRLEAARNGLGATLLPCFAGDAEPGLRRLHDPPPELVEDVFLIVHEDLRDLPAVRSLGTALADLFRDEAAALLGSTGG